MHKQEHELLRKYEALLKSFDLLPVRHPPEAILTSKESGLAHCLWMIGEIQMFLKAGGKENVMKAHRWICFIQGVMWSFQISTVDEFRADNRTL